MNAFAESIWVDGLVIDCIEEKDPAHFPGILQHVQTFLDNSDFKRIREVGFNHVRLPVDYFNL